MLNLEKLTQQFIEEGRDRGIFVDSACEELAVDPQTYGDLTAIQIRIVIPNSYIRRYNQVKSGRDTKKLPDAQTFFEFLRPYLKGKKLVPRRKSVEYENFDYADEELLTYKKYACSWNREDGELILTIDGDLELDEEFDRSFEHDEEPEEY